MEDHALGVSGADRFRCFRARRLSLLCALAELCEEGARVAEEAVGLPKTNWLGVPWKIDFGGGKVNKNNVCQSNEDDQLTVKVRTLLT